MKMNLLFAFVAASTALILSACSSGNSAFKEPFTTSVAERVAATGRNLSDVKNELGSPTTSYSDSGMTVYQYNRKASRPCLARHSGVIAQSKCTVNENRVLQIWVKDDSVQKHQLSGMLFYDLESYTFLPTHGSSATVGNRNETPEELALPYIPMAAGELEEDFNAHYGIERK